jgi:hypothetical protein
MSLINDALKRASSSKPTPAPPPGGPPMQPVESGSDRASPFPIILCIVGIGALLMAGGFWLKSRGTPRSAAAEKSSTPVTIVAETKPAANPIERATTTLQKVVERNSEPAATNASAPTTVASAAVPATPVSTPAPEPVKQQPVPAPAPTFHLQAIYYRMKGPTVVINGKTLKLGDHLDGAKLVSIERNSAEIEYEGKTLRLTVQ